MNLLILFLIGFIVLDVVIVLGIFLYKNKSSFSEKDINFIKMNWFRILDLSSHDLSKAILDADKLLDFALSKKGKTGSLGEKLKKSNHLFKDINSIWRVHKIRNKIAHEFNVPDKKELKDAILVYKKALIDLGIKL